MIDYEGIRETVATGLSEYLGCPVIRANQNEKIPPYPYVSYMITTPLKEHNGTYGEYEDGINRKPCTQTWSITVLSDDDTESILLAIKAHDWVKCIGTMYLNDSNVIVQSVGDINNRDNLISSEYEHRQGFDMTLWLLNEVQNKNKEEIEHFEMGDIENG